MQKHKVIISHPEKQHSYQTAFALQEGELLCKYFTSIWYNPKIFLYKLVNVLPSVLRKVVTKELKKRYFEQIDSKLVVQYPWFDLIGVLLRRIFKSTKVSEVLIHWVNRNFDKWVAGKLKKMDFDLFIGYEGTSLESFKACKNKNIKCILELAAPHFTQQEKPRLEKSILYNEADFLQKKNSIKKTELEIADLILVPSFYSMSSLINAGISESKIRHCPYGVDLQQFDQKKYYRKGGKFILLFVGAIIPRKGLKYLLESYSQLTLSDSELFLVGSMPAGGEIFNQYKGLFKHVPFLLHEELVSYYQNADVFVFPSLDDAFPLAVLEAMASGTPVIISENTGTKDVVRNGIDGFIIPVRNVDALKEKILFFYNNREKVEEMGRNARTQAEKYSWEKYRESIRIQVLR